MSATIHVEWMFSDERDTRFFFALYKGKFSVNFRSLRKYIKEASSLSLHFI